MYQIFAVEPDAVADYVFDESHCQAMKLPFEHGWHHWSVYRKDKSAIVHLGDFRTYQEAEIFVRGLRP